MNSTIYADCTWLVEDLITLAAGNRDPLQHGRLGALLTPAHKLTELGWKLVGDGKRRWQSTNIDHQ